MRKREWALLAFVYLALAEVLSWHPVPDLSLCLIQAEHSEQATNHDEKKYCPAFHTGIIASLDAVDGFLERHDKSVVGGFTIVLAISTIGLWLATNRLWFAGERQLELLAKTASDQSRDMEKSLIAANRPWIKVEIRVGGPIVYNVNGANFTLQYVLTNIGHSPAVNVHVSPRVIFPVLSMEAESKFNPRAELEKIIAAEKARSGPSFFGHSLFPEETITQPITVTMTDDDIKLATALIGAIYPTIVGTVSYRMGLDDESHQTGFIVEIKRDDTPRPSTIQNNRWAGAIWVDEGDVPANEVRLYRSYIDGGYAD
jgi:hypothetical protein